jgi:hypothetical protein
MKLKYGYEEDRIKVAKTLGNMGYVPALPELIYSRSNIDETVWRDAIDTFANNIDVSAVPALIKFLKGEDEYVKMYAALLLGKIGNASAVPALIEALKDENKDVRGCAAEAIGMIRDTSAVPALFDAIALNYGNIWVISPANQALKNIGGASDASELIDFLKVENSDVQKWTFRMLENILRSCQSKEDLQDFEDTLSKGLEKLGRLGKKGKFTVAGLKMIIAEKKNEFAEKKDILLPDKPKPPKKGQMFRRLTMTR